MPNIVYYSDELLRPISAEQPCGEDLSYDLLFREIREARRFDDQELPKWGLVAELCLDALKNRTKDLTLISFLTEASVPLDGFIGLRDCLRLTREILIEFWDKGLIPRIEDGDMDYRSGAFGLLNDKIPDAMAQVAITAGPGYSYSRFHQAQLMGTESAISKTAGDRRETLDGYRRQGWITMDAFDSAVDATPRKVLEAIYSNFEEARKEFVALSMVLDQKFGEASPSLGNARGTFDGMDEILRLILKKKRQQEPDTPAFAPNADGPATGQPRVGFSALTAGLPPDNSQSWADAEALIRSGSVDQGLAQMASLAANESSVRARFLRKLMLVDVCQGVGRQRLAKTILEELKNQIIEFKLERWESSALVGAVWSRLYRLYRNSESSSEQEQAGALYTQLCQLDPWQAYLHCED